MAKQLKDFLKGVDYFRSIDLAEFHKAISQQNYKMIPANQICQNLQ